MGVRFVPNPNFARQVLRDPEAGKVLETVAVIAQNAIKTASPTHKFTRTVRTPTLVLGPDGQTARIVTTSSIWHILEYGSVNNPPYRPLAAGVQAAGLTYEPR